MWEGRYGKLTVKKLSFIHYTYRISINVVDLSKNGCFNGGVLAPEAFHSNLKALRKIINDAAAEELFPAEKKL